MDCRVETGTLRLGNARMKGTKPGDTPSKDGEAQNILQKKTWSGPGDRLGVEGVGGTRSLGLPSPLSYRGEKNDRNGILVFPSLQQNEYGSHSFSPGFYRADALAFSVSGEVLSCPLQSGA